MEMLIELEQRGLVEDVRGGFGAIEGEDADVIVGHMPADDLGHGWGGGLRCSGGFVTRGDREGGGLGGGHRAWSRSSQMGAACRPPTHKGTRASRARRR